MSRVRVLVGTRKGAFILDADGKRDNWNVSGPHFAGWEIYHMKGSPADPNRIYRLADQRLVRAGHPALQRRRQDLGHARRRHRAETGPPGLPGESNKFVYDTSSRETGKPLTTHQWYDGTQHPWEFKRVWHLEPSLTDPDTVLRRRGRRGPVPHHRRRPQSGTSCRACAATAPGRSGSRAPAACACTPSFSIPAIPSRIYIAISAAGAFRTDDGGKTWKPINRGLRSQYIPDPNAEVGHCVHHIAMHPSRPDVLFMQKHWDVMRSDNAGDQLARGQRQSAHRLRLRHRRARARAGDRSTWCPSRATASTFPWKASCASIAAAPAATSGSR